ncbi:MAG TPA: RHS repeat-associated core domain-containing protein [Pyrinomonadaceae bacterium]
MTRVAPLSLTTVGQTGKFVFIALAWCALFFTPPRAAAQDERNPQSSVGNRARTDLRIDPVSHALQFQIPLGQYSGRAGADTPVVLNYSSKLWNVKYMSTIRCVDDPGSLYRAEYAKSSASGWTSTLDWFLWPQDLSLETYDPLTTRAASKGTNLRRIARIYVTLPDGSRHELRKDDDFHAAAEVITGLFYSVDGSRLVYDTTTHTLYLPDGSRYVTSYDPTTQTPTVVTSTDRNGNQLAYNYSTGQWADTLGRAFGLPLPTSGVGDAAGLVDHDTTYSVPGVGGSPLTYTLRWRHLSTAGVISEQETVQTLRYKGDHTTNCQNGTDNSGLFHSADGSYDGILKSNLFDPVVLYQIALPNGQAYTFKYDIYGEVSKVVYPTGGYERFAYGAAPMLSAQDSLGLYSQANRGVTDAWISPDGTAASEAHWSYEGFSTIAPDGTRTDRSVFTNQYDWSAYGFEDPRLGMIYDERTYAPSGAALRRRLTDYAVDGQVVQAGGYNMYKQRNPRPAKVVDILLDTGGNALAATTTSDYDADLNQTVVRRYDYASVAQATAQSGASSAMPLGTLVRTDETVYLVNDPSVAQGTRDGYRARNLIALPTVSRLHQGDATGPVVSETRVRYDETGLQAYGGAQGWGDPGAGARGNATTVSRWLDTSNTWLETRAEYDQFGNAWKSTDARGKVSQVEYSASYQYAYPTRTISAAPDASGQRGSATALESFTAYDLSTGLVTSTTDANGQTTSYQYNDPLNRLKQVTRPDGGRTTYTYVDAHQCGPYVESRTLLDASGRETDSWQFFDGLGRPYLSETYENQDANNPYIRVDTQYDALGRAWRVSNPYRSAGCGAPTNPPGRWTTTAYDALSRVKTVTTPDGAAANTSYSGNQVTVTDQAGKVRSSVSDALGRLASVTEAPGVTGYGFVTNYAYDAMGNLRRVDQGGQLRFFMYDSLSRLIRAKNPEQTGSIAADADFPALTDATSGTPNGNWSMGYTYDANSNLYKRKDARNTVTTYGYDDLNRLIRTDYSDGTPYTLNTYDFATNGRGLYYADYESSTSGTLNYVLSYDAVGRPKTRTTGFYLSGTGWVWGFDSARNYDLAGNVTSETYPSGHTVSYNYDAAGRLGDNGANPAFSGNLGDGAQRTYSAGVSYDEASRMREERFGTATPLYHKLHYNVRGQLFDVRLSSVAWTSANGEWDWNRGALLNYYSQAEINSPTNEGHGLSGVENNGNLKRASVYVPTDPNASYSDVGAGSYYVAHDDYSYDPLNRLTSVGETNSVGAAVSQSYDYDRFGNRTINAAGTSAGVNSKQFTVDAATNRLTHAGVAYDDAGNLTYDTYSDPQSAGARTYDAENRMTMAWSGNAASGTYQTRYTYDAAGKRTRRDLNGQVTWQVYGFGGELIAEYAGGGAPSSPQKEYGYRGGALLVTAQAGDPSAQLSSFVTSFYASVLSRQPTGGELSSGVASLAAAMGQGQAAFFDAASQMGQNLFLSQEYANRGRTDHWFVYDLYVAFLGREPDSGGWAAWEAGVPSQGRPANIYGFSSSGNGEWVNRSNAQYAAAAAAQGGVNWMVSDHLGTPRMTVDQTGSLGGVKRHDYLPFGEEIGAGTGGRTTGQGYGQIDNVRQHFTGKERDSETGLDYFGARYYSSPMGRWVSPDWSETPEPVPYADLANPQTLNLYAYVNNNPLFTSDADGHVALLPEWLQRWINASRGLGWKTDAEIEAERRAAETKKAQDAYKAAEALRKLGFDPNQISRLSNQQVIDFYNALQRGETSVVSDGRKIVLDIIPAAGSNKPEHSLPPSVRNKLGNLVSRAEEKVSDVIRSRGGSGANVKEVGHWAEKTLAETAQAAAKGDKTAAKAIKIVKSAGRLGQKH